MPKNAATKKSDALSAATKKPDAANGAKPGKQAWNSIKLSEQPALPTLTPKQQLFGTSYTGKTPLTLLQEYCQKHAWQKPDVTSKQLSANEHTAIVYLRKRNPKDASVIDTVVMKAPDDSEIRIARSSAAEARHFAAVYALFRFANNLNLRNVLPPLCRDYFTLLEKHKTETSKDKAFLWSADPFAAALPISGAESKKKPEHKPRSPELRLSQKALEEVEACKHLIERRLPTQ